MKRLKRLACWWLCHDWQMEIHPSPCGCPFVGWKCARCGEAVAPRLLQEPNCKAHDMVGFYRKMLDAGSSPRDSVTLEGLK